MITGADDVDYSTETGGVCAIYDAVADDPDVTLTEHDDCFVIVGTGGFGSSTFDAIAEGLAGNDVLCGSAGDDNNFEGMRSDSRQLDRARPCPAPFP